MTDSEDGDLFHESLETLISDTESDPYPTTTRPYPTTTSYDVWISKPSSVQDRRNSLFARFGLSHINNNNNSSSYNSYNSYSNSSYNIDNDEISSNEIISNEISSNGFSRNEISSEKVKNSGEDCFLVNFDEKVDLIDSFSVCEKVVNDDISPNKPPLGKNMKRVDEIRAKSSNLDLENIEKDAFLEKVEKDRLSVCTIKNLDNGNEFVVNGNENKLKEVGTGRNLTMEEFESFLGHSPIVQELMRRQNVEDGNKDGFDSTPNGNSNGSNGMKVKKKGSWLKSLRNSISGSKERRSSDERDTSSEKGGQRSSSATDDSQDVSFHGPERVRVRQYGKHWKEVSALYKSQEIQAHNGSIWSIKFSLDGKYLASAGEDCVIHVWQVVESERKGDLLMDKMEDGNLSLFFSGSPELSTLSPNLEGFGEKKRRGRSSISRKSVGIEHILVPETVFALSEKAICSFQGHLDDVLDLSWSKSQHLLSSSMDKTVRLWHLSSNACLKIFSHSDYVTCIQFNPVDDNYFISGSLDGKVRIWSIPDRQVVDWNDLHEMVTAACYTPDGQGALVGTYKGSCRVYNTSENKLQQKGQINLQNRKKKSRQKKITGFQFAPGSSTEVLITSADSRIRVIDDIDLVHKFKGFRNTNSQISASLTANGKYVVSASEDSHVYIWKHDGSSRPNRRKGVTVTRSYEHFHCQDVSVAIPWPGMSDSCGYLCTSSAEQNRGYEVSAIDHPPTPVEEMNGNETSPLASRCSNSPLHCTISSASNNYFFDRISATWPEEKLSLATTKNRSPRVSVDFTNEVISQSRSAWGMIIVTAGLRAKSEHSRILECRFGFKGFDVNKIYSVILSC